MTSQSKPKNKHTALLYRFINARRIELGQTWEDLDRDIRRSAEKSRFGTVSVRMVQEWAHGKSTPKYKSIMAALLGLDLDEESAFEVYKRIWESRGLRPQTTTNRGGQGAAFPSREIQRSVLNDPRINQLPAVFETGQRLPVATTFVDLRVVERRASFKRELLQPIETPGQQIWQRERRLRLPRRPAQQVLDASTMRPSILIGGPGSGKSALMRRVALDVAKGLWRGAKTPLFVELRRYWSRRVENPDSDLTLIGFALEEHLPHLRTDPATRKLFEQMLWDREVDGVLLLADGLDEIAALPEAVDAIYGELEALAKVVPWIASSRPTGLQRLISGARRLEIDPLSLDAIECLIGAWSAANGAPDWFSGALYAEVAASANLQQMAGNPFLLTALCFLRHSDLDRALPDSKASIYQRLFEQIARQAQRRHSDASILDAPTVRALERFCNALYSTGETPKQIFSDYDWQTFGTAEIDFDRQVLPARLITALNEEDTDYHFMHLSLQEHLVARALLSGDMPDVLQIRFHPAWRSVFRTYGALLHESGRHDDFRALVTTLFGETDLLRLSLFNLAEIFADAGIQDTSKWLGEDLRSRIWDILTEGWNEVPAQALEAIRYLDAEYLEAKARLALEELEQDLAYLKETYPEDFESAVFPGEPYQQYGFEETQAPRILARSGTDTAHKHIRSLFLNGPQHIALAVATAFADLARPSDRLELAKLAETSPADSDLAYRLFAFAIASPAAELLPLLGKILEHNRSERNDLWDRALGLVMQIGGELAHEILQDQLARDIAAWNAHPKELREKYDPIPESVGLENNNLVTLLSRLQELELHAHIALLDFAETNLDTERYKTMLYGGRLKSGIVDDKDVLSDLDDPSRRDEVMSALIRAPARSGRPISLAVRARVLRDFDLGTVDDKAFIAEVEAAAIRAGGPPMAVGKCISTAEQIWSSFRHAPDAGEMSMLIARLDRLLSPAQDAQDQSALPVIKSILLDHRFLAEIEPDLAEDLLSMLMDAVRDILGDDLIEKRPDQANAFIPVFQELMFDDVLDVTQNAAAALGYLDLPSLLGLRGAATVDNVLEEISAERDILIFEGFWTGPDGRIHAYHDTRPGIGVLVQDERGEDAMATLRHHLVGQGFAFGTVEELKRRFVKGFVLIEPDPDNPDAERAEALKGVVQMLKTEWQVPLLRRPVEEIELNPKAAAISIKTALDVLYETEGGN